jgi:hypothetical protein
MAKLIVQHDEDPGIAIVLEYVPPGTPGRPQGWHGTCTQCGRPMHRWDGEVAIAGARVHVDSHESAL